MQADVVPAPGERPDTPERSSEAARYAVLRRIGPALKHDLVVNLQAVAMMAEVLGARLEKSQPSHGDVQHHVSRIHRVAREAVGNSLKVAAWLAPSDDDSVGLHDALADSLDLVRSNFSFRGFTLRMEAAPVDFEVSGDLLRHLLLASLIHLTDRAATPGELLVQARLEAGMARLTLQLMPGPARSQAQADESDYRRLQDGDVQALAAAAGVQVQEEEGRIVLRLPRLVARSPLGIAPR